MKIEVRDVSIKGKLIKRMKVLVCPICDGHMPVTKKVADGECVGHINVKVAK